MRFSSKYNKDWSWLAPGIVKQRYFQVISAFSIPLWPDNGQIDYANRHWLEADGIIEILGFEQVDEHKYKRLKIRICTRDNAPLMEVGIPDFITGFEQGLLRPCTVFKNPPAQEPKRGFEFL